MEKAPDFDARRPLVNRSLRCLPSVLKDYGPMEEWLRNLHVVSLARIAEKEETARLLYVALARAETHSIMAFDDPAESNNILGDSVADDHLYRDVPTIVD